MTMGQGLHNMHIVRTMSRSFFLFLSMLVCFGVNPVSSSPQEEYPGWFSRHDFKDDSSPSSLPPPPGTMSSKKKLNKCVFGDEFAMEEEESFVLLRETLVVDGCLLECDKVLRSTVADGSILTVRNGGHVKNCSVVLVKEKYYIDSSDNINLEDETTSGTIAPTTWGTYYTTDEASEWATWVEKRTNYIAHSVAGFLCDQGDCLLENSVCSPPEYDSDEPPSSVRIMQDCIKVELGANDVRVEGGLVDEENRPVSVYGIAVDAGYDREKHSSPEVEKDYAKARLFVDNATIRNQLRNGIIIVGGVNTVRISDSVISNNLGDGIYVNGGYGLAFFAVLGGSMENNGGSGIHIDEYHSKQDSQNAGNDESMYFPARVEAVISDVLLKQNQENGLRVIRIDDIAIDGAVIDGNSLNGIYIWSATTINLQGVVCKNNIRNGLSVEAEGSTVEISNSVFLANGYDLGKSAPQWRRAGIYMWLPKRVAITNSVSDSNSMDGILIYDVPDLSFTDVDVMRNGNDGIEVRETAAAFGYDYTADTDYLVGAYYYPWHGKNFHNGGGYLRKELTPPQSPTLGEYDDSDPDIITKHLEWFRKSNIGLLVTSWWGPNRIEDSNTKDVLMEHELIGNLKIALHYETTGRIKEENGEDMSIPKSDIQYMCENYFDHPNYYKIDGRPVLVIYISRKLEQLGTLELALLTMRTVASKCGHNIYLIGDAVFAKAPEAKNSFGYFDAVTNYDVYGSSGGPKQDSPYAGTEAVDNFYSEQEKWRNLAFEEDCRYIPPVSPGYNDRAVRPEKDNQPLSRRLTESSEEGSLFKYQLEKALPLVDPEVDNLILVNSFNEWHEDTQIEPVKAVNKSKGNVATEPEELTFGLEYVGYGELYLDILRDATSRSAAEKKEVTYEPTRVDFTNVRSCKNGEDGMRFYITENSLDGQTELVFNPGPGVISCANKGFDYEMYGGGNVEFVASPSDGMIGDRCANGKQTIGCEFSHLLNTCKKSHCHRRNIVTIGGGVINDHNIK